MACRSRAAAIPSGIGVGTPISALRVHSPPPHRPRFHGALDELRERAVAGGERPAPQDQEAGDDGEVSDVECEAGGERRRVAALVPGIRVE